MKVVELLTPATAKMFAKKYGKLYFPVAGRCMEAVDIYDGDSIGVDLAKAPVPRKQGEKDIVLVWLSGQLGVKEYIGAWGPSQWVGTCYSDIGIREDGTVRINAALPVDCIFGVVFECLAPDGTVKWKRDISENPTKLSYKQMIKGGNVKLIEGGEKHAMQSNNSNVHGRDN